MIQEHFAERPGVKLHYLSSGDSEELTPLVYLPGLGSDAESFRDEMKRLYPRPTVGVGKRGLGKSSIVETGYSFYEQVSDLAAVIKDARQSNFCLMAFSVSVPIVLSYALEHPDTLEGLILLDYRARYPQLPQDWAQGMAQHLPSAYALGVQRESEEVDLWSTLSAITCPVMVIRGGQSNHLTADEGKLYLSALPNVRQVTFENSGHEVYKPDYERFLTTVEGFLQELDNEQKVQHD